MSAGSEDGAMVIRLKGRLGASAAPRFADTLANAVNTGHRRVRVDLANLDYISSAGILAIEAAAARLRSDEGSLEISGATGAVKIALELAGTA